MMRNLLASLTVLVCANVLLFAQGGSNYSALGIGDLRPWVGAQYDALSGTQIGMPTAYGINLVNPSLMGFTPTTRIQAGYHFNQHVISENGQSTAQNNGNFDGLMAMFSVDTSRGFAFALGVVPVSKVAYLTERDLRTEIDGGAVTGVSRQQGEGGVSQAQLSASVRLLPSLRIGLGFGGVFGVLTYSDKLIIDGNYSQVTSSQSYDVRGLLYRAGMYWEPISSFGIGAFVVGGGNGTDYVTRHAYAVSGSAVYLDTTEIEAIATPLPLQYGVGVSMIVGSGRLGADLHVSDFTQANVNLRSDAGYTRGIRTSLGYAQFGDQRPGASFMHRIGWYLGASYQQLYVTFKGHNIDEYSGSTGISFPLGGNAMVDAALSGGWRGPAQSQELTELFARLTVTVSIGEVWFKPFARD